MTSQAQNKQMQQQQMFTYFDTVLLDFDNEIEMQKLADKLKKMRSAKNNAKQK